LKDSISAFWSSEERQENLKRAGRLVASVFVECPWVQGLFRPPNDVVLYKRLDGSRKPFAFVVQIPVFVRINIRQQPFNRPFGFQTRR
jgi:hypothetical protein